MDSVKKLRIEYIDECRGFAMLMVVLGHVILFSGLNTDSIFYRLSSITATPLFFIISGLCINDENFITLVKTKLPLLLSPIIIGSIYISISKNADYIGCIKDQMKYGYWFTFALFEIYVILYFTKKIIIFFCSNKLLQFVIVLLPAVLLLVFTKMHIISEDIDNIFSITQMSVGYFFVWVGMFFKNFNDIYKFFLKSSFGDLIFLIIFIIFFFNTTNFFTVMIQRFCGAWLCISFFSYYSHKIPLFIKNFLSYSGKCTLVIYCCHYFFIQNLSCIFDNKEFANDSIYLLLLLVLTSILIIISTCGLNLIFIKNKMLAYSICGKIKK